MDNIAGDTMAYILNSLCCSFENLAKDQGAECFRQSAQSFIFFTGIEKSSSTVPSDNAIHIANIALEILKLDTGSLMEEKYSQYLKGMKAKIGIATGNLMLSVSGASLLSIDTWGESRTLAEQISNVASPNEVLLSEETRFFLSTKQFTCQTKSVKFSFPTKIYSLTGKIYSSNDNGMKIFGAM